MNCEVCGTELPHGALFCGECGRAVGMRAATALHPDSGMPVEPTPDEATAATEILVTSDAAGAALRAAIDWLETTATERLRSSLGPAKLFAEFEDLCHRARKEQP